MAKNSFVPYAPLVGMVAATGLVMAGLRVLPSSADTSISASVKVPESCSFTGVTDEENKHSATIINGRYKEDIGITTLRTYCNDANGYQVQAVGFSNDMLGNTNMINSSSDDLANNYIATGLYPGAATNDLASSWAMKLKAQGTTFRPVITTGFNDYHVIPSGATAMTITGSSNYNDAKYDICPSGWHLPSGRYSGGDNTIAEGMDLHAIFQGLHYGDAGNDYLKAFFSQPGDVWGWSGSVYSHTHVATYGYDKNTDMVRSTAVVRTYAEAVRCVRTE